MVIGSPCGIGGMRHSLDRDMYDDKLFISTSAWRLFVEFCECENF